MNSIGNNLNVLDRLNPYLADEVAKLPEIRKFRTHSSRLTLSNLIKIYEFAPDVFDRMFVAMNKIGVQANRKYCSALQALFWLIQDEKISVIGMLLNLWIEQGVDEKEIRRSYLVLLCHFDLRLLSENPSSSCLR